MSAAINSGREDLFQIISPVDDVFFDRDREVHRRAGAFGYCLALPRVQVDDFEELL